MIELSICIPTLNRAAFIGETIDSIVSQLVDGVEVVVVDGGSKDGTQAIVASYSQRFPAIRYINRGGGNVPSNAGFDRDCDYAVEIARAPHCWLMTDDDVLKPGAVARVLDGVRQGHDIVVVSCEVRDIKLERMIIDARPGIASDRMFPPERWDDFFRLVVLHLTFLGALVIRRDLWRARKAEDYFGTGFVHVGVLFREPAKGTALVIAEPLVVIRNGNNQWGSRAFDIFMLRWPRLIWSFSGIREKSKSFITPEEPWQLLRVLLLQRAFGRFTTREYDLVEANLDGSLKRAIARCIAQIPVGLLYWPARLYGRVKHSDPRYFTETLNEARRASRSQ